MRCSFKLLRLTILVAFLSISGWAARDSFAATLTENLRSFFNGGLSDFSKKMKLENFEVTPYRYITVKGDAAKFRALNWMNDGTTGGIKDMFFEGDLDKDSHLTFEGHAIPGDNDFGTGLELTKGDGGYVKMDYGNFRRWYDVYGGYFTNFSSNSIDKMKVDPALDIGHFNFEIGKGGNENPGLGLSYARNTKDGIKSRLSWGSITEGATTRKIGTSWQDIGTVSDAIELKGNIGVAGFNVNGKQKAEFYNGRTMREDNDQTTYVQTTEEPAAKRLVSSIKADRWSKDDKSYVALAYQFSHLTSDMWSLIQAYNSTTGAIVSDSHNGIVDGQANRDSHSWVEHFSTNLTPNLSFSTKLKEEIIAAYGSGYRQGLLGGANRADESENQTTVTGESFSLRYSGFSKTSLYTDWDFQQSRQWNSKDRVGTSHSEYLDTNPELTGVLGLRYIPSSKFNITSNFRTKSDHNTYDIFSNNDTGLTISRIQTESNEWSNRFTWKPAKWLQNSFRLQLLDTVYRIQSTPQYVSKTDWIKANANSRIYSYDAMIQPSDEWMFDVGASLNQSKVSTPASQVAVSGGGIPTFTANVYSLFLSTSYIPKENFSIYSSAQYSRSDNFNSYSFLGIPFGNNNERYDATIGMKWSPKKDLTLEPKFGYYVYRANPDDNYSMDYGNYTAQVYWLDTKLNW